MSDELAEAINQLAKDLQAKDVADLQRRKADVVNWIVRKIDPQKDHCEIQIYDMMGITTVTLRPINSNITYTEGRGNDAFEALEAAMRKESGNV